MCVYYMFCSDIFVAVKFKIIPEFCSSILQNGHFILEVFLNQELTDEILSFGKCSSENFRCKSSE